MIHRLNDSDLRQVRGPKPCPAHLDPRWHEPYDADWTLPTMRDRLDCPGSPLGRGTTPEEAVRDLVRRTSADQPDGVFAYEGTHGKFAYKAGLAG